MSFYKSYPQCPAAFSLDEILKEKGEERYSRNISSIIEISMKSFKEVTKIKFLTNLALELSYKERCKVVDKLKVSSLTKEHIKCIINSGYRKYLSKQNKKI